MKPIRLDVMPTGLREILAVHADDVRGVIEAAAVYEGRTHPVDVDRHAERLEALDLLSVEAARGDDAHMSIAGFVERGAQQLDQARRDAADVAATGETLLLLQLANDRQVHQRFAGVDADAPEALSERVRDPQRGVHDVVAEIHEGRDVHVTFRRSLRGEVADAIRGAVDVLVELQGRDRRVAAVDRDERVRHRAQAPRAPPLALLVGGHRDRAADVRGVAGTGLRLVTLVARAEHDHRLPVGGGDDLAGVRRDARALGQGSQVERLEVRERRVLALDVHHRLAGLRDLPVVERAHLQILPAGLPQRGELVRDLEDLARDRLVVLPRLPGQREPARIEPALGVEVAREYSLRAFALAVPAGADMQERKDLVGADDHRIGMLLEDLHRDVLTSLVALENELGAREVDVALVARADLLDRKPEDLGPQAIADHHRSRTCS